MDPMRRIADAVLYEGYILWPYRRSAMKNRQRWTFGGVYPKAHSEGREDDPWEQQTQCLVESGEGARVDVRVRFLHVVDRQVARDAAPGLEPVDELTVAGERYLSWQEAVEREVVTGPLPLAELEQPRRFEVEVAGGSEEEELCDESGARAGVLVRSWRELAGVVIVRTEPIEAALHRLTVRIENTSPFDGASREDALLQSFASTHTAVVAEGGELVSLTDPPDHRRAAAEACENIGTWPVLVGEEGERHRLLSSPIILPDYPEIAPESPGDLFDGGEIDQLLTLNILTLTDEEKREMRDSDPRAREILERTEALTNDELMRLHGAIREFQSVRGP